MSYQLKLCRICQVNLLTKFGACIATNNKKFSSVPGGNPVILSNLAKYRNICRSGLTIMSARNVHERLQTVINFLKSCKLSLQLPREIFLLPPPLTPVSVAGIRKTRRPSTNIGRSDYRSPDYNNSASIPFASFSTPVTFSKRQTPLETPGSKAFTIPCR